MTGDDLFRKPNQFYIKSKNSFSVYSFAKNPLYLFRYSVYLLIYFISVLIIFLFQRILESRLKEKYELRNQVHELQLKTLRNQLDPHFIYNTFNTIASVIKQGKSNEAYDLFVQLSKMIRSNLEGSNEIYTTLKKELDFVRDYLTIQKKRFGELFEYEIITDKNVPQNLKIPKMLIQIHAENALKHGIRPLLNGGILTIRVIDEPQLTTIEIRDNGIGRRKAKEISSDSTGIGLKTIQQIIELNNANESQKITQQIVDLKDEKGLDCGTLVILKIKQRINKVDSNR